MISAHTYFCTSPGTFIPALRNTERGTGKETMTNLYLSDYYVPTTVLSTLQGSFILHKSLGYEPLLLHYTEDEAEAQRG